MGTVHYLPTRQNVVMVQACKGGFEVVLSTFSGYRYRLGICENLGQARSLAHAEAFKVGRCRVQVLGTGALS